MNICVFCFGRIRTLVAMATDSSHRLIMGKVEIDNSSVSIGIFQCYFRHTAVVNQLDKCSDEFKFRTKLYKQSKLIFTSVCLYTYFINDLGVC